MQVESSKQPSPLLRLIEYAVVTAVISVAAVALYSFLGQTLQQQVAQITAKIAGVKTETAATSGGINKGTNPSMDLDEYSGSNATDN